MYKTFPEIPKVFFFTEEGEQYTETLLKDTVTKNMSFVARKDFKGKDVRIKIEKETGNVSTFLYHIDCWVENKEEEITGLCFYMEGITEQSRDLLLFITEVKKLLKDSVFIDNNITLYCTFLKEKNSYVMYMYAAAIDFMLCTQKELEHLVCFCKKEAKIEGKKIHTEIFKTGTLAELIDPSLINIAGDYGYTVYPENFVVENNVKAICFRISGYMGQQYKPNKTNTDYYKKIILGISEQGILDIVEVQKGIPTNVSEAIDLSKAVISKTLDKIEETNPDLYKEIKQLPNNTKKRLFSGVTRDLVFKYLDERFFDNYGSSCDNLFRHAFSEF